MGDINRYVDSALPSGTVTSTGTGAYTIEYNFGRALKDHEREGYWFARLQAAIEACRTESCDS